MTGLSGVDGQMCPVLFLDFRGDLIAKFNQSQVELPIGRPDLKVEAAAKLAAFFSLVRSDRYWTGEILLTPSIYVAQAEFLWKRRCLEVIKEAYDEGARMAAEANGPVDDLDFGSGLFA